MRQSLGIYARISDILISDILEEAAKQEPIGQKCHSVYLFEVFRFSKPN